MFFGNIQRQECPLTMYECYNAPRAKTSKKQQDKNYHMSEHTHISDSASLYVLLYVDYYTNIVEAHLTQPFVQV